MREATSAHAAFLASPECAHQFELMWLRQSRLALMLGELSTKTKRADGWMVLATAANIIKQLEPAELKDLFKRFGHRTLKTFLQACEVFDVDEEPTTKGGTRTIYRINSGFELHIQQQPTCLLSP